MLKHKLLPGNFDSLREIPLVGNLHDVPPDPLVILREHRRGVLNFRGTRRRRSLIPGLARGQIVPPLDGQMVRRRRRRAERLPVDRLVQHAEHPALVAELPGLPRGRLFFRGIRGSDVWRCFSLDAVVSLEWCDAEIFAIVTFVGIVRKAASLPILRYRIVL